MDSLLIKEAHTSQLLPPQRLLPPLRKLLAVLRAFVIGGLLLLALAYTSKRAWHVPEGRTTIAQDVVRAANDNRTICVVEVTPERARKPAVGFDLTDSYGYV